MAPTPALCRDAGLERRGGSLPGRRLRSPRSPTRSARRPTSTTPRPSGERYRALDAALAGVPHRICYAVKANSNLAVLRILRELGAGADIVSGGRAGPRARRRLPARPHRVQRGGEDAPTSCAPRSQAGIGPPQRRVGARSSQRLARDRRAQERPTSRSASGSIRTSRPIPIPYISTGKSGIKFGVPVDQVLPRRRADRRAPAARAHHARDASREPARRTPSRSGRASAGCSSWSSGSGEPGSTPLEVTRHRRRARASGTRRAADGPGRFAAAVVPLLAPTGLHGLPRAGPVSGRQRRRAAHRGALPQALGRQGVRGGGRRDERPGPAQPLPGLPRDRRARANAADRRCGWTWWARSARPATSWRSTGCCPDLAAGDRLAVLGAGAYGFVMASNYNTRPRPRRSWWTATAGGWRGARETVEDLYRVERMTRA